MKTFTVYRQTVQSVKDSSNLINKVGWDGVVATGNTSAILKLESLSLYVDELSPKAKAIITKALDENVLLPVATIECETLDDAFRLSNTINCMWTENEECTEIQNNQPMFLSSSCSGDVFQDNQTGEMFVTLLFGFATL